MLARQSGLSPARLSPRFPQLRDNKDEMADESDAGIEMDEDEDDFFVSFVTVLFSFLFFSFSLSLLLFP